LSYLHLFFSFVMMQRTPYSSLFPYTTLFRSQQDQAGDVAVELVGRQPVGEDVADEQPGQQCHRERLDRPVDEQRHADATPVLAKDRKSTRLNSSHVKISYAVFCLKKKKIKKK